ncbi:Mitogen-activated protein kinase kinase kinase 20 [Cardamine amara subsp. amara]|uniref:Mitogen-activated protein kinase kinase kinase 20 n=1 Tax=Cardamine amara subsp. amara TaxID=228776 RepID=A0ABD0ZNB3_CARAN
MPRSTSSDRLGRWDDEDWNRPHKKPKYSQENPFSKMSVTEDEADSSIINIPESNRWIVTRSLGKSSQYSVYLAECTVDGDEEDLPLEMVIKSTEMLKADLLENEERFLSHLKSPFVVSFYGYETTLEKNEKTTFERKVIYNTIHEYCQGGSIANHIKRHNGNIPKDDVRQFACDILVGLKYIHGEKIIHCDIKPKNILLACEDPRFSSSDRFMAKISGFGKAIEKGSVEYGDGLGHHRGSVRYLSPEELRGDMVLDYGSDVWAYGCLVLEMLTGERVWEEYGKLGWEGMVSLIGESDAVPRIPDYLSETAKDFLSKCLERDPAKRWSVDSLLEHQYLKWIDEEEEEEEEGEEFEEGEDEDVYYGIGDAQVEEYEANLEIAEAFQEEEEAYEDEEEEQEEQEEIELDEDYPKADSEDDDI